MCVRLAPLDHWMARNPNSKRPRALPFLPPPPCPQCVRAVVFSFLSLHFAAVPSLWSTFDLIALDGQDLRREPIESARLRSSSMLRNTKGRLQLNEHSAEPGDLVFKHACQLGLELAWAKAPPRTRNDERHDL